MTDGAASVAILGDGLWRRRFGADPGVLGRAILIDGAPHTVVGVMAPGAQLPGPLAGSDDIWLPARMSPAERTNPISHNYTVLARLADGVTPAQASAEMATLAATLTAEHPDTHTGLGARVVPIAEDTVRTIRPALLLLARRRRAAAPDRVRQRRDAARRARGEPPAGDRRPLRARRDTRPPALARRRRKRAARDRRRDRGARTRRLGPARRAAALRGFAAARRADRASICASPPASSRTAILSGLAFGVVVALLGPSAHVADALRSGARTSGAPRETRARSVLVVSQIALAVVLLAASGLMVRSVVRLSRVGPGFDADRVLTFRLSLDGSRYAALPARAAFASELHGAPRLLRPACRRRR